MSIDRFSVLQAYAETKAAQATLRSRAAIERHQSKLWRRLTPAIARTPALSSLAGAPLSAFPIVEPHQMRGRPEHWNSLGLSTEAIWAAAEAAELGKPGEVRPGISAGFSTGSSGVRGVFLSSQQERARYLGQSLAKLLPGGLLRRRRIGLCLRANNALYRDVANAGPFAFRFFDLSTPPRDMAREISAFSPDIFIAPSHVLAALAELAAAGDFTSPPFERLYYGAEPMGDSEQRWVTQALRARPDPIYQATEGFLGAACKHGTLHLNEDSIHFEFERVGQSQRYRPIVTDLRRTSQPMVRVRLDDLVEFQDAPCSCGTALRAIHPVEGRITSVWRWGESMIFPREIEVAISEALPPGAKWCASASPKGVHLACDGPDADKARAALASLLSDAGVPQAIILTPFQPTNTPKRCQVEWTDG